ncbi:ComEC/Rec2 family competence protein [Rossellomorea aquimaris]|uniref:hypothetical protein n=1 Tax=Rossellomorea aquimaris TaxID=189382 RepID=UPI0007D08827|nr:hypothetical protein [Rossellomorea aquimaris]
MRVVISTILIFFIVISSTMGMKIPQVNLNVSHDEYAITFLPLKRGEVAMLHLGSGENYLINTGPMAEYDQLLYYLKQINISTFSGIIITEDREYHPDSILKLNKIFSINNVIMASSLAKSIKQNDGIKVTPILENQSFSLSNELSIEVIHEGNEVREGLDFSITFFHHRFLWLSSQSLHSENVLLKKKLGSVNIVKIPIHSKTESISNRLLMHIDPQTAVLYRSKEKLLNGDTLEAINEAWIDLYLTGQHGLISIKFNQSNYEVITFDQEDVFNKETFSN